MAIRKIDGVVAEKLRNSDVLLSGDPKGDSLGLRHQLNVAAAKGALQSITHPSYLYFTVPSTDLVECFNKTLKSLLRKWIKAPTLCRSC